MKFITISFWLLFALAAPVVAQSADHRVRDHRVLHYGHAESRERDRDNN